MLWFFYFIKHKSRTQRRYKEDLKEHNIEKYKKGGFI